jgi:hypothetical protein
LVGGQIGAGLWRGRKGRVVERRGKGVETSTVRLEEESVEVREERPDLQRSPPPRDDQGQGDRVNF